MILLNLDNLSCVKKFLVDGGYSGERFANQVKEICGAQVEVVKRSELHKFVVLPRRWVVERLFGWLDKFRRLWKNCERKLFISHQIPNLLGTDFPLLQTGLAQCGYPLAVLNWKNAAGEDKLYFVCRTNQWFTKAGGCTSHTIKEETVTQAVVEKVREVCGAYLQADQLLP